MNKARRKQIDAIVEKLQELYADLESIQADEEEARDNIPESLWETERFEKAEASVDALEDAAGLFDELVEALETAKDPDY